MKALKKQMLLAMDGRSIAEVIVYQPGCQVGLRIVRSAEQQPLRSQINRPDDRLGTQAALEGFRLF